MTVTTTERAQGAARAVPCDDCRHDCRLVATLGQDGTPLAYWQADGHPPCPACRRALARLRGPQRVSEPHRPRRGRAPEARASWAEGLDWVADAFRVASQKDQRLVWISLSRRPRWLDGLARRVTGMVPQAVWVRWIPPVERVGRLAAVWGRRAGDRGLEALTEADAVLCWGADPLCGGTGIRQRYKALLRQAAPSVVVDPRVTAAARRADVHLAVRPGTDAALAAALIHELRADRAPRWTSVWPLSRAAPVCGLPEEAAGEVIRRLTEARHPALLVGGGIAWHGEPQETFRALGELAAAAGAALVAPASAPDPSEGMDVPLETPQPREVLSLDDPLGTGESPSGVVAVVEGCVDLETRPGGAVLADWLAGADRVLALTDAWGSVARAADMVLPVPSPFERRDVVGLRSPRAHWGARAARGRPRDMPAPWALWRSVARRMAWPAEWFEIDEADAIAGLDGSPASPSAAASEASRPPEHRELGEGPVATPVLAETYPLQAVIGGEGPGDGTGELAIATLAPAEAELRGVRAGDLVTVFNARGALQARLVIEEGTPPGVVGLSERGAALLVGRDGGEAVGGGLVQLAPTRA